jgi:hypothetical protein
MSHRDDRPIPGEPSYRASHRGLIRRIQMGRRLVEEHQPSVP